MNCYKIEISTDDLGKKTYRYRNFATDRLHCLDGHALQYPGGEEYYYIDGEIVSKQTWLQKIAELNQPKKYTCDGKIVEIEGKKYQLKLVD
jgi:hypothetical protein